MSHKDTKGNTMSVSAVNGSPITGREDRPKLPVPVVSVAKSGDGPARRHQPRHNFPAGTRFLPLVRPVAPFLAQLALQYDEIGVVRRRRVERLEMAARSYHAAPASAGQPRGYRHDLTA
jgi:hypothetical protein